MTGPDIDLDFRPRYLVPWLSVDQERTYAPAFQNEDDGDMLVCPPPEPDAPRRPQPPGPYFLAMFALEPASYVYPCRGFLLARPRKRRRFEIEDSRNTRRGVESFGKVMVPRIPTMREVIALLDDALNRGWEEFGPPLSTWQETARARRRRFPEDWTLLVCSANYPQLPEWYRRQWVALG